MKCYEITFKVNTTEDGAKVNLERKAELNLTDETRIGDITRFDTDADKILRDIRKAYKRGDSITVELIASTYIRDETDHLKQTSFDMWTFNGYLEDDEGLYLSPDTRYTEATRDIWVDNKAHGFMAALETI